MTNPFVSPCPTRPPSAHRDHLRAAGAGPEAEALQRRQHRTIGLTDLTSLVSLLPRPLGTRRPDSRLVFPIASAVLCVVALCGLYESPAFHPRRVSAERDRDYELARTQSLGFFDDVPSSSWTRIRDRSRSTPPHNDAKLGLRSEFADRDDPARWYSNNWDPDFTCPGERRVGGMGDGGKWVCDPRRMRTQADGREAKGGGGCLVYSSGLGWDAAVEGGGVFNLAFETALLQELGEGARCDLHVFDHRASADRLPQPLPPGVVVHPWSIEGESDRKKGRRTHLTFAETVKKLDHGGRTVDLLKVDCEGCEWTQYRDWFDASSSASSLVGINQILVELHGAPRTGNDFFEHIRRNGYVSFHKEVDAQFGGSWVEYGFLRLSKDFFAD